MTQTIRQPWQVMYASISALVIRDIQKKFIKNVNTQRSIGFLWIIFEPMLHVSVWMMMRTILGHGFYSSPYLPYPIFILAGAVPFFLFRNIISGSKNSIKGNKSFYIFRQIKPIDPMIAKLISELMVNIPVFIIFLGIFSWYGYQWQFHNFLFFLVNLCSYLLFLFGFALIISIVCFFFDFINTIMTVGMRMFYFLSGIFFSAEMIPAKIRAICLYNPVFQFIELTRSCFKPDYSYVAYGSGLYLFKASLLVLILGMALYTTLREKIMTEIEQR